MSAAFSSTSSSSGSKNAISARGSFRGFKYWPIRVAGLLVTMPSSMRRLNVWRTGARRLRAKLYRQNEPVNVSALETRLGQVAMLADEVLVELNVGPERSVRRRRTLEFAHRAHISRSNGIAARESPTLGDSEARQFPLSLGGGLATAERL